MKNNNISDVFFDLDHTLWDFDANSKSAFKKLLKKYNIDLTIEEFCKIYEPINDRYWEEYSQGNKTKEQVKLGRLKESFEILKIDTTDIFITNFADEYLYLLKNETSLIDGSIEILEYLKDKYRLHILTNGFIEIQETKIRNAGLKKYFDQIISSEEIGKQKPHPDVFKYALNKAKTFAHKSIMIGDNFKSDILGAINAGMKVIFFDLHNQATVDSRIIPKINKLTEIKELL